ncbi:MAG: hypothetical protein SangKO_050300 [Sandaracinaceae bacterium]
MAKAGAHGMDDGPQPPTGMPRGTAAAHTVGLALLEGMLIESACSEPSTVGALAAAVCRMRLPPSFDGGGRADPSADQWRLRDAVHATLPEGERPSTPPCPTE